MTVELLLVTSSGDALLERLLLLPFPFDELPLLPFPFDDEPPLPLLRELALELVPETFEPFPPLLPLLLGLLDPKARTTNSNNKNR